MGHFVLVRGVDYSRLVAKRRSRLFPALQNFTRSMRAGPTNWSDLFSMYMMRDEGMKAL